MKKYLILLFTALSLVTTQAQKIGGFGYIGVGASFITSIQIQNRLQGESLYGSEFSFNEPGIHTGVRIMGAYKRFLVGGTGYNNTFTGGSERGEVNLRITGRFFNLGYLLINKPKTKGYAFLGVGSGSSRLRTSINDMGWQDIGFGPNQNISDLLSPEVLQKSIGYEFGAGVYRLINKKSTAGKINSGFLVGLVAGFNLFPSTTWVFQYNGTEVENMGNISSVYFGITIGGGGFSNE